MAPRIQEIHPTIVHYPIALLPTALVFDTAGHITGDEAALTAGRHLITAAAASAALAGLAGYVAQGAIRTNGRIAHDHLVTHRTLNAGLTVLLGAMALIRSRRRHPGAAYLLVGAAGAAVMAYSAYLGGKMVYEHGVGVNRAGGLDLAAAPEIRAGTLGVAARTAARNAASALRETARSSARGELLPDLR